MLRNKQIAAARERNSERPRSTTRIGISFLVLKMATGHLNMRVSWMSLFCGVGTSRGISHWALFRNIFEPALCAIVWQATEHSDSRIVTQDKDNHIKTRMSDGWMVEMTFSCIGYRILLTISVNGGRRNTKRSCVVGHSAKLRVGLTNSRLPSPRNILRTWTANSFIFELPTLL